MNNRPKKNVLLVITKSNWGGAQRYVFDLATCLPPERYNVAVALGGEGPLYEKLAARGILTIPVCGFQRDISIVKEVRALLSLVRIIRSKRPHVLHLNSSKAGGIGALVGRLCGVQRVVYTAHAWAFNEDRSLLSRAVIALLHGFTVLLAHRTITVSNAMRTQMKVPGTQRKMTAIHNGRAHPECRPREEARAALIAQAPALGRYHKDVWTGTIAELHPVKQHSLVIDAVARLRHKGVTLRHIIIGDGEQREYLNRLVREKGLHEQVFVLGHVDEAARYLAAFDIAVLASRSEALGYFLIEAGYAGVPVVASNVGGIPEVVTHEVSGLLFPSGDSAALATHLKTLRTDAATGRRYARALYTKVATQFSCEHMVRETAALYEAT